MGSVLAISFLSIEQIEVNSNSNMAFLMATAHSLSPTANTDVVQIWRMSPLIPKSTDDASVGETPESDAIPIFTIQDHSMPFSQIRRIVTQKGNPEPLICIIDDNGGHLVSSSKDQYTPLSSKCVKMENASCENAVWDTHNSFSVLTTHSRNSAKYQCQGIHTNGGMLSLWDIREFAAKGPSGIANTEKYAPISIDVNTNMQYKIVSGNSDGTIRFWDTRKFVKPFQEISSIHAHWVTQTSLNPFHDQLLLSGSTDGNIKLHQCENAFSKNPQKVIHKDGLVCTDDRAEDSIIGLEWSANDAWTFCSLAYNGYIAFHQVPCKEKYRILLL